MQFLIMIDIFSEFLLKWEIYSQDRFKKTKTTNQLNFFANLEQNFKKKNLRRHFWQLSDYSTEFHL